MATDFAVSLRRFLTDHLAGVRGCSPNTIASYRDAFKLLICYFRDERGVAPERLTLELIDAAAIIGFLDWLATSRENSASTRNQRLAAIDSFFTWMQTQDPARMACCQDILAIPSSKHHRPAVAHLTVEQTRLLLALPDRSTRQGRRDATLLATLYDTAARVQETADLRVRDIRLKDPAMVALTGKGRKTRHVLIDANTAALLAAYLTERRLEDPGRDDHPLFFNQHHAKLSRGGIAWILRKYQAQAADPTLADAQLSPHILRHSRAVGHEPQARADEVHQARLHPGAPRVGQARTPPRAAAACADHRTSHLRARGPTRDRHGLGGRPLRATRPQAA